MSKKNETVDSIINNTTHFKRKRVVYTSYDNLKMTGLLTYSNLDETKGTIILLHGTGLNKLHFLNLSEFLSKNGYNSVALDLRGTGESEGKFFSYGPKESKDVVKLVDYLITNEHLNNIGVWGQSVGGGIAIQTMGMDKRIKFGIAESTYTNIKAATRDEIKRHSGLSLTPFTNYLVDRSGSIGGFDADDANPYKYAKQVTQPILIVHGAKDIAMAVDYGKANFDNIKSTDKQFIVIDSAGHTNIWKIGGDKYFNKVLQFLNKQSFN